MTNKSTTMPGSNFGSMLNPLIQYGGSLASSLFGSNPYSDYSSDLAPIEDQLKQYYEKGSSYLEPFYQSGIGAIGDYSNALKEMRDPAEFYNRLMSDYTESPSAQFQRKQGIENIGANAATKGLLGSTAEGRNIEQFSQGLTSQDMQNYLNNLMNIHGQYMGGEQGLMGQGFGAGQGIAGMYSGLGQNIASLQQAAAQAQAAQEASNQSNLGDLIGEGADLASMLFL